MDRVVESYRLTLSLPKSETYGLASQIQRAAASIPANIAEGHGREPIGDDLHHLSIAKGSLMELETHIMVASRLNYVQQQEADRILEQTGTVGRMLAGLIRSLKKNCRT